MKKLYLLFILLTALTSCSSENDFISKDLEAYQLKGNVKSVRVATYEAIENFGKVVKGKLKIGNYETIDITEFDELGNITTISSYNKHGDFDGKRIYTYKNNKLDYVTSYGAKGNIVLKNVYNWDDELLLSSVIYDNQGKESSRTIYEYEDNKKISTKLYMNDVLMVRVDVVKFDGDLPLETVSYNRDGKETNRTFREYKNGKLSLHSTYKGSYGVNEEGLMTKSVDCYNVLNDYTDKVKGIFIYEYEFDKKGNWIKCIVYREEIKIPYQIVEREISYR